MHDVGAWEEQLRRHGVHGQQGGGGTPAPSGISQQGANELGIGALGLLLLAWVATGAADKALRRRGA